MFLYILTAAIQTVRLFQYPNVMKQHAQAILLLTGYPLEPIVALQIKKSFQSQLPAAMNNMIRATQAQSTRNVSKRKRAKP